MEAAWWGAPSPTRSPVAVCRSCCWRPRTGLALAASGTNSGILHTGFDATPGELETALILRSVALREELLDELGVVAWRCGALLAPRR